MVKVAITPIKTSLNLKFIIFFNTMYFSEINIRRNRFSSKKTFSYHLFVEINVNFLGKKRR